MCKKIVFVTSSRSDFGLIRSIVKKCINDTRFHLYIIRIGHSLIDDIDFEEFNNTDSVLKINTSVGTKNISTSVETTNFISEIIFEVGKKFDELNPDIVFIPGDRFEILASAVSAYYQRIPIAHIFGGDKSEGGHLDDNIRHAITKISHLHFTVCQDSYERVLKLGEESGRVFNVGSPVVDNINEIIFNNPLNKKYILVSFHPITTQPENSYRDMKELLSALSCYNYDVVITSPNNEYGSKDILRVINEFVTIYDNFKFIGNLGWRNYLNYLKHCIFSIGNSSSNLLEAPIVNTYSIDVGDRQKGRYAPSTVYHCNCYKADIQKTIKQVISIPMNSHTHPYGNGNTAGKVLDIINSFLQKDGILIKKITY